MSRRVRFFLFLTLSIACLAAAGLLTLQQSARYRDLLGIFPYGTQIAGIPVDGLDAQAAGTRIAQVYALTPVELRLDGSAIHIDPLQAGQQLDLEGMLSSAEASLESGSGGLWDYLLNRAPAPVEAGLACSVDENRLREFLTGQIAGRYTSPPSPAHPIPGDVLFQPGEPGETVDLESALPSVRDALCSASDRTVDLSTQPTQALPPVVEMLAPMLETLIQVSDFDGTMELYFQDLRSGKETRLAFADRQPVEPEIAFTGASTIKVPVMVSAYKRLEGELPADLRQLMASMIDLSDNGSTDEVMQRVLDANIAPVQVTQDMQALGLKNTFLAGFFYLGAPLLDLYQTPANQRTDLSTDPDVYNQTTAADMGPPAGQHLYLCSPGQRPINRYFSRANHPGRMPGNG